MHEPYASALSATKTVVDPARALYINRRIFATLCDINVLLLFVQLAEHDHDCDVCNNNLLHSSVWPESEAAGGPSTKKVTYLFR